MRYNEISQGGKCKKSMLTQIPLQCKVCIPRFLLLTGVNWVKMWAQFCPNSESGWFRSLIGGMSSLLDFNRIIKTSNQPLCFRIPPTNVSPIFYCCAQRCMVGEQSLRVVGMEVSMPCPVHMTRQGGIDSTEIYMGSLPPGHDMKPYDTSDNQNSRVCIGNPHHFWESMCV